MAPVRTVVSSPMILPRAELLDALDRAPFAHRIDLERAVLELAFLPALGEILHPPGDALGVVLVVLDLEALGGEEALLDRDPPGPVMGVAVALQADGTGHGGVPCFAVAPQVFRTGMPGTRVYA